MEKTLTLENERFSIKVKSLGAELSSLYSKELQIEYIWPGSSASWSGHSPVLFPIIGALAGDQYTFNGQSYAMGQHGFGRKSLWQTHSITGDSIALQLVDTPKTRQMYPFSFCFTLTHILLDNGLLIEFRIENLGTAVMPFSVGGHPAFNCPIVRDKRGLRFNDYQLLFDKPEDTQCHLKTGPLLTGKSRPFVLSDGRMALDHADFSQGALIFDDLRSRKITLLSPKDERGVTVDFNGFTHLGLWTYPGQPADYICVEPWFGMDAGEGDPPDLEKRPGIVSLDPGKIFKKSYSIHPF